MDESPVAIPASLPVEIALDEYFLRYQWSWFPVTDEGGRFAGVVMRDAIDEVDEAERGLKTVSDCIDGSSTRSHVAQDAPLESLLGNPDLRRFGALMVTDHAGRLAGVITVEQVGRALRPV
jgi:predicted transcriptional regulator